MSTPYAPWSNIAADRLTSADVGAMISLPGLVVVWFRESLAQTSIARGIARKSPPALVAVLGWFLPVAVPLLILWQVQ